MKRRLLIAFAFAALAVAPARADLKSDEREARKSTPTQENDLAKWKWANFVVLAGVLWYVAQKQGKPRLDKKSTELARDLNDARGRRSEAEARSAEVNRKLADLGAEIETFRTSVLAEQAAQMDRLRAQAQTEHERIRASAAQQIDTLGKHARLDLRKHASQLALQLAEERIRGTMNPQLQRVITSQFVSDLGA